MAFSKHVMFLVVLSCIVYLNFACLSNDPTVGGWKDIEDLNDPRIQAIAKFALEEGHKLLKGSKSFTFVRVAEGKQAAVAGTLYQLLIVASRAGDEQPSKYEAKIWVQPWRKFQKLLSFKLTNCKV